MLRSAPSYPPLLNGEDVLMLLVGLGIFIASHPPKIFLPTCLNTNSNLNVLTYNLSSVAYTSILFKFVQSKMH